MFKKCWENNKTQSSFESSENKEEDRDSGLHQTYPIRKSINYGTRLQAAKGTFLEYSKESSIHGFKYIGNHKHPVADRLIWVCALVLSIITCCFFIRNIWNQRVNNPVIVTFNEKLTHVWEIPFPSVTVCPEIKTEPLIFNFTEVYWKIQENKNVTKKEVFYWKALSQICIFGSLSETEVPYAEDFANASDLKEAMTDFAPSLSNVIVAFAWEDTPYDSVKGFKTVVTEEGICFTFNSLTSIHYSKELKNTNIQNDDFYKITDIPKWSVEKGFNKGEQIDTYPRRVIGSGNKEGLKIWLLSFKENEDLLCRKNFKGFKVILHTPGDEPQVSNKFIHAQPDKSSLISIKPKIVQASENLMYYEPYMRKCFYQHERPLRYFEVYSQPNCERECLANRTLADCGCVHFALPRNSTDRVCGLQQRSCLRTAVDLVKRMNFEEATRHSQSHESSTFCNCLPLCTSIQYKAELEYQNDFDIAEMGRAHQMETDPGFESSENKEEYRDSGLHQTYPIRKSLNYGTKLQAAKGTFLEYFKESSIHGFKYIGNHRHSVADRLIWLCALILSIITCCFLIRNIWNQRVNNPVIVTFNEKLTHVWEIPFPSVTICPDIKNWVQTFNYTEVYWKIQRDENITEKEEFYWKALRQICMLGLLVEEPYAEDFANASDLKEAITELAPNSRSVILGYSWGDTFYDDSETEEFNTVVTEEGICFSFNSLTSIHYRKELKDANIQNDNFYKITDIPKWSVEKGFNKGEQIDTYPRRVIGSGYNEGLRIWLMSLKENEDLLCRQHFKGFKVILHTPGEEPQVFNKFIHAQPEKSSLISIKPKIVQASENLMNYEPYMRKCFYQDERPLMYFELYNQPNCERECLAKHMLSKCGCVHFAFPRNSTDRVCGIKKRSCIKSAVRLVKRMNFEEETRHSQSNEYSTFCNCLPLCTSVQYKAELEYQNDFDFAELNRALQMESVPGLQVTEIIINFKEDLFNGLKRSELYSEADLIASCGGLLGLFMGVSILSLVEVVYYFTVKLWANLKTRNLKNRQLKKFKEIP